MTYDPKITLKMADELVTLIDGQDFQQSKTVERRYRPKHDLTELHELRITVMPGAFDEEIDNQAGIRQVVPILLCVAKAVEDRENATIDPLLTIARQVGNLARLNPPQCSRWIGTVPVRDKDVLEWVARAIDQESIFFDIVQANFRVVQFDD